MVEKAEENGWDYTKDGSNAPVECHGTKAGGAGQGADEESVY